MKKLYCLIAIISLSILFTSPSAFGQDLDGKWFQVTFSAKGYISSGPWGSPDMYGVGGTDSGKAVNYYQFVYNDLWSTACPAGYTPQFYPFYEIHLWYPVGGGWSSYIYGDFDAVDGCYGMLYGCPNFQKTFLDRQFVANGHGNDWWNFEGGDILEGWANGTTIIDIKRQGSAIKSATLKSYGCTSEFATADSTWSLGSCTIKGKLIKPEKLPDGIPEAGVGPKFTTVDLCAPPP